MQYTINYFNLLYYIYIYTHTRIHATLHYNTRSEDQVGLVLDVDAEDAGDLGHLGVRAGQLGPSSCLYIACCYYFQKCTCKGI